MLAVTRDKTNNESEHVCVICSDHSAMWHYGAVVCEACKKFFIRSNKDRREYACVNQDKMCNITISNRAVCQYCRLAKCIQVGMALKKNSTTTDSLLTDYLVNSQCSICSAQSSGIHFGVLSCQACKNFYRRGTRNNAYLNYKCCRENMCQIHESSRSCRSCRYKKCVQSGMSLQKIKTGRKSNFTKQRIFKEKTTNNGNDRMEGDSSTLICEQMMTQPKKETRFDMDVETSSNSGVSNDSDNSYNSCNFNYQAVPSNAFHSLENNLGAYLANSGMNMNNYKYNPSPATFNYSYPNWSYLPNQALMLPILGNLPFNLNN